MKGNKMKAIKEIFQGIKMMPIGITMSLIFVVIISCSGQKTNDQVYEAYALRINGHADSAKVSLEKLLLEDSTNAMAWYELCRTIQHFGNANPQEVKESITEALRCIKQAVKYDPDNVWYLSYLGGIESLEFYVAIQTGDENPGQYLETVEKTYNTVFELDTSYTENILTLVELFGRLPPEMGGDLEKAEQYATELEDVDMVAGAKARELLMPDDADYVSFWKDVIDKDPENAEVYQALGRVYLFKENFDNASKNYQKAIDLDPSKNELYLDLGRFYLILAMQNPNLLDSVAPLVEGQFNKYLNFNPEPIKPMRAWTYNQLAMIKKHLGDEEAFEKLQQKAEDLDPYRSFAFGKPNMAIYCPPDVVLHEQGYYLSPF